MPAFDAKQSRRPVLAADEIQTFAAVPGRMGRFTSGGPARVAASAFLLMAAADSSAQVGVPGFTGPVEATAVVVAGGVTCPLVRLSDGRIFALQGPALPYSQLVPGTNVHVAGQSVAFSTCMQGPALQVTEIVIVGPRP